MEEPSHGHIPKGRIPCRGCSRMVCDIFAHRVSIHTSFSFASAAYCSSGIRRLVLEREWPWRLNANTQSRQQYMFSCRWDWRYSSRPRLALACVNKPDEIDFLSSLDAAKEEYSWILGSNRLRSSLFSSFSFLSLQKCTPGDHARSVCIQRWQSTWKSLPLCYYAIMLSVATA
jgi:hypothetical protein